MMELDKDPNLVLAFAFPAGTIGEPAALKRVAGGIIVQDSERDQLQAAMLQRGVLLSACAMAGSPDDAAAAQEKFKAGELRVPRDTFLLAAGTLMQEQSDLFTGNKLDQPRRLKLMSEEALEALRAIPQTPKSKSLIEKIQGRLKKANLT
jgi:hypothetical protein